MIPSHAPYISTLPVVFSLFPTQGRYIDAAHPASPQGLEAAACQASQPCFSWGCLMA